MFTSKYAMVLLPLALIAHLAQAQTQRSGGEAQRFMQQYQQISAEKAALQGQLADLQKDLDATKAQLAAAKKDHDAQQGRASASAAAAVTQANAARDAAEKNLEQYKQRMTELVSRFRETATNLKDVEADRSQLKRTLEERNAAFGKCAADNAELLKINNEVLDRYGHIGVFTKVGSADPFTHITKNRLDNFAVEYQEKAQEHEVKKPASN
ncbi:MAG TPA: hypothetical protein VGI93_12785 [Steroidobacteraceae bacterium]|jgi:chromosome segregation ATPase